MAASGIGVVSYMGHRSTCPLDFQLFNFSGHFRPAQTLTFDSMTVHVVAACPVKEIYRPIALSLFFCTNFIIFCVTLKLFSFSFVPLLAPNPGDATGQWTILWNREETSESLDDKVDFFKLCFSSASNSSSLNTSSLSSSVTTNIHVICFTF